MLNADALGVEGEGTFYVSYLHSPSFDEMRTASIYINSCYLYSFDRGNLNDSYPPTFVNVQKLRHEIKILAQKEKKLDDDLMVSIVNHFIGSYFSLLCRSKKIIRFRKRTKV
jgi:hypothetical protein